jgi:hypothetical protein
MMSLLGSKSGKADKAAKAAEKKAAKAAAKAAKPAKPAKAAKQAAKPAADRGVLVEKPKANIYTVLLILSFVAVVIGSLCLYGEMSAYNFEIKPRI